jgi:hypothetical protein
MTFKELRPNNPIHLLDKSDGVKYCQGKVLNVGQPRFDTQQMPQPGTMPSMPNMVVDVTIEANGKTETYKFAENASVGGVGNMLVSTDINGVIREIDATIAKDEQYFADKEKVEKEYEQCKKLKSELDPAFKEKQETESRFHTIEKQQEEQGKMLKEQGDMLKKIYEKLNT